MPPPIVSNTDRWTLSYKPVNTQPEPLPKGIERIFIDSPGGKLEILSAVPKPDAIYHSKPPIFFQHGGFGCAQVWLGKYGDNFNELMLNFILFACYEKDMVFDSG